MPLERKTLFSDCRKFRYTLWRDWAQQLKPNGAQTLHFTADPHADFYPGKPDKFVMFIGLNPSTANETQDDPTIRRCIGFAKAWGFGAYCMTNLFAFCTAYPAVLIENGVKIGEDGIFRDKCDEGHFTNRNDYWLNSIGREAGMIVAAWGAFPCAVERAKAVRGMFAGRLHHLGLTRAGHPKHPLYLKKDTEPKLWA